MTRAPENWQTQWKHMSESEQVTNSHSFEFWLFIISVQTRLLHEVQLDFSLSWKASLSLLTMVKNAAETGKSFISVVPVGGVDYRLTNGPVEMLQMSE